MRRLRCTIGGLPCAILLLAFAYGWTSSHILYHG
jgi:hypothetical protein